MNPGDVVTVYEDPFTCEIPEGEARLIERVQTFDPEPGEPERWIVQFIGPGESPVHRWIKRSS